MAGRCRQSAFTGCYPSNQPPHGASNSPLTRPPQGFSSIASGAPPTQNAMQSVVDVALPGEHTSAALHNQKCCSPRSIASYASGRDWRVRCQHQPLSRRRSLPEPWFSGYCAPLHPGHCTVEGALSYDAQCTVLEQTVSFLDREWSPESRQRARIALLCTHRRIDAADAA
jgi:hypothetical protein